MNTDKSLKCVEELNDLKSVNKKLKADLKDVQNYNNELIANEQFLSGCALELVGLPPDIDIYEFTALKMKELFPDSIVMVTTYDEKSDIFGLASIKGLNKAKIDSVGKIFGKNFMESIITFKDMDEVIQQCLYTHEFKHLKRGLYAATGGVFPKKLCKLLEKSARINEVCGIGILRKNTLYGAVSVFSFNETPLTKKDIVETLINMVSVALQRKKSEDKINRALEEKELLMKEIHHRSKNNLMIISSLLNLKSKNIKDNEARAIFKESQDRAKSMALIHEHLYSSDDLKRIDFGEYLKILALNLFKSYIEDSKRIKLNLNIENCMLDINNAVALGLITNELITNSIKYAFPTNVSQKPITNQSTTSKETGGEITLEFHKFDDLFTLIIKDNGIGFPDDLDFHNCSSMGLQIVNMLISQIEGHITLNNENGTEFIITFEEMY